MNECGDAITKPLNQAILQGRYRDYYTCGEIIELLAQAALRQHGYGPLAHWNAMFGELNGGKFTSFDYFKALNELTADDLVTKAINQLATKGFRTKEEAVSVLRSYEIDIGEKSPVGGEIVEYEILGWRGPSQ